MASKMVAGYAATHALASLLLMSCHAANGPNNPTRAEKSVVAGPGEAAFDQQYHLTLHLPMPEAEFLRLLKQRGLDYEVIGERGTKKLIASPRLSQSLDLSQIARQYQIYGDIDRSQHIGKMYWAYADTRGNIVYIENAFTYTGP